VPPFLRMGIWDVLVRSLGGRPPGWGNGGRETATNVGS
jgi:hypothetical protein